MVILKVLLLLFLSTIYVNAQFNEFKYEAPKEDSIITEQPPIVIGESVVKENKGNAKYVANFIFAGTGLKNNPVRSTIYKALDVIFLAGAIASRYQSNQAENEYKSFAAKHAGVYPANDELVNAMTHIESLQKLDGKDGYNTVLFKNDLQKDMIDEIDGNVWLWDSEEHFKKYKEKVSNKDKYNNQMFIFIGGMFLNRVVSTIDIAVSSKKLKMVPTASSKSIGLQIQGDL